MRTVYYVWASLDGFVATDDDELDWLYRLDRGDGADFARFDAGVGAVVMGSATYESVLRDSDLLSHPERWQQAHAGRAVFVCTHRRLPVIPGADVRFVDGPASVVHDQLVAAAGGRDVWVAGGGGLASSFAAAGRLDELVVGVAPVVLGGGKPLLTGPLSADRLQLAGVRQVGQLAYLTYRLTGTGRG
ncbi:dihydrofolate reductase family protein [Actinocatenispora comari]|uniref:Riboflavin biosynthesis protein RibD n=1 Tax=Actinocatenispora comari TaxID=2807577 RepID=A0A8J4ABY6_9ACTN|nr:dihydrofolate reductase family protein [Actinocatenispora comari]GIL28501.1 riboflavin biosynthesis protein RibD [Actinocatenispora comari]